MPSIGSRVYELREQDEHAWYRVIYLAKIGNRIYVLHCFEKKSARLQNDEPANVAVTGCGPRKSQIASVP